MNTRQSIVTAAAASAAGFPTRRAEPRIPCVMPAAHPILTEAADGYKAGAQDLVLENLERHARDFQDLARCIQGQTVFAHHKKHDYLVQQTPLRDCGLSA